MTAASWNSFADDALAGRLIERANALAVLRAPDEALLDQLGAAYRVRRHFWGNRVRLHYLLNAQSGLCPEDCGYCSQSSVSTADIEHYPMLARERILAAAGRAAELKAATFCLVISGRAPGEGVFGKVLGAVEEIRRRHDLKVCVCLGLLTPAQTHRLANAGVETVNHNLNTSERHYAAICSTHTFSDRVDTVRHVAAAGIKTCSGGIVGMGESDDDLIDLAHRLRELDVRSVPVNFLIPIPGTPLEDMHALNPRRCLRVLCLFRFMLPSQEIRIAGGREVQLRSLQPLGLYAANSMFVGDYLTTPGQAPAADFAMIRDMGFVLETPDGEPWDLPGFFESADDPADPTSARRPIPSGAGRSGLPQTDPSGPGR